MVYPPISLALVFLLMWVGGCAGSTAGGIKIARVVLVEQLYRASTLLWGGAYHH